MTVQPHPRAGRLIKEGGRGQTWCAARRPRRRRAHRRHTHSAATTAQFVTGVVSVRAPLAAMGSPRLHPLP